MNTSNAKKIEAWAPRAGGEIIYLEPRKRTRVRRRAAPKSDAVWNVLFVVLCLAVLFCLFVL